VTPDDLVWQESIRRFHDLAGVDIRSTSLPGAAGLPVALGAGRDSSLSRTLVVLHLIPRDASPSDVQAEGRVRDGKPIMIFSVGREGRWDLFRQSVGLLSTRDRPAVIDTCPLLIALPDERVGVAPARRSWPHGASSIGCSMPDWARRWLMMRS